MKYNICPLFEKNNCRIVFVDDPSKGKDIADAVFELHPEYRVEINPVFQRRKIGPLNLKNKNSIWKILSSSKTAKDESASFLSQELERMELEHFKDRMPATLSTHMLERASILYDAMCNRKTFLISDCWFDPTQGNCTVHKDQNHYHTLASWFRSFDTFSWVGCDLIWITGVSVQEFLQRFGKTAAEDSFYTFYALTNDQVVEQDKQVLITTTTFIEPAAPESTLSTEHPKQEPKTVSDVSRPVQKKKPVATKEQKISNAPKNDGDYWTQQVKVSELLQAAKNPDREVAFSNYKMAFAEGGHNAASQMFWRFIVRNGLYSSAPQGFSMKELCKQLTQGAVAGDAGCMFALALCYSKEFFCTNDYGNYYDRSLKSPLTPNPDKFFYWLKKAYESGSGHPGAHIMMAQYYATGKIWCHSLYTLTPTYQAEIRQINQAKAFAILEPVYRQLDNAIRSGYDEHISYWYHVCMPLIAMMHLDGRGTSADPRKACACIGVGFNASSETLLLRPNHYVRLRGVRLALNEAIGANDDGCYKLLKDEDVD